MGNKQIAKESRNFLKNNLKISVLMCLILTLITNTISLINTNEKVLYSIISIALFIIEPALSYGITISFMKLQKSESVKVYDFIVLGFKNFSKAWSIIFRNFLKLWPQILSFVVISILTFVLSSNMFLTLITNNASTTADIFGYAVIWMYSLLLFYVILYLIIVYPKSLYYFFSNYVMIDNNNSITAKEAVEKSKELMKNKRLKYFKFILGILGWYFLIAIVFSVILTVVSRVFNNNINNTIISRIASIIILPFFYAYLRISNIHFYESLKQENNE